MALFGIINPDGVILYQTVLGSTVYIDDPNLPNMLAWTSHDNFDILSKERQGCYLGIVEIFGDWKAFGMLSVSGERIIILIYSDGKTAFDESQVRQFLLNSHEEWTKSVIFNPFYQRINCVVSKINDKVLLHSESNKILERANSFSRLLPKTLQDFDVKLRLIARKYGLN